METVWASARSFSALIAARFNEAALAFVSLFPPWVTPNRLSWFRMALALPLFLLFRNEFYLEAVIVFGFGGILDFLDGFLARARNLMTELGAFLDPLADKVFVAAILFGLAPKLALVPVIFIWINVGMAAILTAVRVYKWIKQMNFAATGNGKLKLHLELAMLSALTFGVWLDNVLLLGAGCGLLFILPVFAGMSLQSQLEPLLADEPR